MGSTINAASPIFSTRGLVTASKPQRAKAESGVPPVVSVVWPACGHMAGMSLMRRQTGITTLYTRNRPSSARLKQLTCYIQSTRCLVLTALRCDRLRYRNKATAPSDPSCSAISAIHLLRGSCFVFRLTKLGQDRAWRGWPRLEQEENTTGPPPAGSKPGLSEVNCEIHMEYSLMKRQISSNHAKQTRGELRCLLRARAWLHALAVVSLMVVCGCYADDNLGYKIWQMPTIHLGKGICSTRHTIFHVQEAFL